MTTSVRYNDQNPIDYTDLLFTLLASIALVKSLTTEEVSSLATLLPALFAALPLLRR